MLDTHPPRGCRRLDERHRRGGIECFGERFTGTPSAGFGLSDGGARDDRIGWCLTSAVPNAPGFEVRLDATRRDPASGNVPPERGSRRPRSETRQPGGHPSENRSGRVLEGGVRSRGAARNRYGSNGAIYRPATGVSAPPSHPKTPGSTDTGGTNERCERNGPSAAHAVDLARSIQTGALRVALSRARLTTRRWRGGRAPLRPTRTACEGRVRRER